MTLEGLVVGGGTLLLAVFTAVLAWQTRKLANSSAADLKAQWRPIILPDSFSPDAPLDDFEHDDLHGTMRVRVRNGGRGHALFIRAELDLEGRSALQEPVAALAVGDQQLLTFDTGKKLGRENAYLQLLVDYRDLAGRSYSTSITLDPWKRTFYDVQLPEAAKPSAKGKIQSQPIRAADQLTSDAEFEEALELAAQGGVISGTTLSPEVVDKLAAVRAAAPNPPQHRLRAAREALRRSRQPTK